jgi:hypothetical protein
LCDMLGNCFMRPFGKIVSTLATFVTLTMAGSALAEAITWNTNTTTGSCAIGFTCNASERSFLGSDGTTVVTAQAWSYRTPGYTNGDVIGSASLGFYGNGLGVTNNANDGSHTVDNDGYTDFVAFYFSEEVDIQSVFLSTYGDTDMTAWIGNVPGIPDFTGLNFDDLDTNYGDSFDNLGGNVNRLAEFGGDAESGNLLVVAALRSGNSGYSDLFKIKALYAESFATEPDDPLPPNAVSGPSSLLVFGPAVFGFAMMRRRRARKAAAEAVVDGSDESDKAAT